MKPATRKLALKAARIHKRANAPASEIAKRLRVDEPKATEILFRGILIAQHEAHRLTDQEADVMATLARLEARRVHLAGRPCEIGEVDFAAKKRSGWCGKIIAPRLRQARPSDAGMRDITNRLDFVANPNPAGLIWLTPAGWAFVWATGLISKNWKVPA